MREATFDFKTSGQAWAFAQDLIESDHPYMYVVGLPGRIRAAYDPDTITEVVGIALTHVPVQITIE